MEKKRADYLLGRIYKTLKDPDVRLRLDRSLGKIYGECSLSWRHPERVTITVNPAKKGARGGFMSTLLHECLHMVLADLDEKAICSLEKEMFEVLTDRQLENLLKKAACRILKG
jgi:hypothetical protein